MSKDFTYVLTFDREKPDGEWRLLDISKVSAVVAMRNPNYVVFRAPYQETDDGDGRPPKVFRDEYERRVGRPEFLPYKEQQSPNVVEMIADEDDCAWDQPCSFGHRVEFHAVYCHADHWLYAPRKCRRNQDTWPHEKCPGFRANPLVPSLS